MPDAAVGVFLALKRRGERRVCLLTLSQRRSADHDGANQRVSELEAVGWTDEAGRLSRLERIGCHAEPFTRTQHRRRIAGVVELRNEGECLRELRQPLDACRERRLNARRKWDRVG